MNRTVARTSDDRQMKRYYHGTRADLKPGDLIDPGHTPHFGDRARTTNVYFTRTLDAAAWGAAGSSSCSQPARSKRTRI
jgi:hypothetical protein